MEEFWNWPECDKITLCVEGEVKNTASFRKKLQDAVIVRFRTTNLKLTKFAEVMHNCMFAVVEHRKQGDMTTVAFPQLPNCLFVVAQTDCIVDLPKEIPSCVLLSIFVYGDIMDDFPSAPNMRSIGYPDDLEQSDVPNMPKLTHIYKNSIWVICKNGTITKRINGRLYVLKHA